MIKAYYTEIDIQWSSDELQENLLLLPPQLQQKILAYKYWKGRQLRICGKLLLIKLLADFNKPFSLADLQYNKWNKPYFDDTFDFNIAHSGNVVVCVATSEGEIGVDIEHITGQSASIDRSVNAGRSVPLRPPIGKRPASGTSGTLYDLRSKRDASTSDASVEIDINEMQEHLTANEWQILNSSPDKNATFYNFWVRKEALLKAAGRGADAPFSSIEVINDVVDYNNSRYYLYNVNLKDGYAVCVATNKEEKAILFTQM